MCSPPLIDPCVPVQRCRREWARAFAASAGITTPGTSKTQPSSHAWKIPSIKHVIEALAEAERKAATAQAEAMDSGWRCEAYKRKNVFSAKCKHCGRRPTECQRSRDAHKVHLIEKKKVAEATKTMVKLSSAISLMLFMSQRPGLVRVVGVKVLMYYYATTVI